MTIVESALRYAALNAFSSLCLFIEMYHSSLWREDTIKTKKGSTGNSDDIGFKLDAEVLHFNLYSLQNVSRHSN